MRTIATLIVLVTLSLATTHAQGFLDIPVNNTWTKVQDGAATQWSIRSSAQPNTRIDLVSYTEDGKRTTYYLVRSTCSNGEVAKSVIKPGNMVGLGTDCSGNVVTVTSTMITEAPKLPPAAATLIE